MIHQTYSLRSRIWIALIFLTGLAAGCPAQTAKPVLVALNKVEGSLAIVDPTTMKLIAKVPTGDNPHEVILSSDGKTAFVTNYGAQTPGNSLSVIDIATAKELRRVDPNVKIIAISGGGLGKAGDYLGIARMLGAMRTLAKPFVPEALLAMIADVLADPDTPKVSPHRE